MTFKELNGLHYISKQIERYEMEIRKIEERLTGISPSLTGMPHATGAHDKIGEGVPELVDKKNELEEKRGKLRDEEKRLQDYIDAVPDPKIQLLMQYRFIDMMTWQEVADEAGGRNSENSVQMIIKRYLKREGGES